jgi:branched-chain amino acid transport system permease protein
VSYYYIFLILAAGSVYIVHRMYHSALGHHLRAIASDEEAAQALGVNTNRVQLVALFWSVGITGLLGVFYTQYVYMIEPEWAFSQTLFALQPALNGIIGGLGTVWGPVLGAVLMTPLGEYLRSYLGALEQGLNFFVYGLVLIGVVMVLPGGIISPILACIRHRKGRRSGSSSGKGEPE